jgi:hypothetical protein
MRPASQRAVAAGGAEISGVRYPEEVENRTVFEDAVRMRRWHEVYHSEFFPRTGPLPILQPV